MAYVYTQNGTSDITSGASAGLVGIGTSSPSKKLHVLGSAVGGSYSSEALLVLEGDGNTALNIKSASDSYGRIDFGDSGAAAIGSIAYYHQGNEMQFTTNSSARVTIKSDGKVGIGTGSPTEQLDVNGNIICTGRASIVDSTWPMLYVTTPGMNYQAILQSGASHNTLEFIGQDSSVQVDGAFAFSILTNSNTRLHITSGGNVGIGTTDPKTKLHSTGSTIVGVNNGSVGDANIGTGQVNIYLDESNNKLKFRVRYSDGTTLKTGEVSLT